MSYNWLAKMCQINKLHFDVWCLRWLIDLSHFYSHFSRLYLGRAHSCWSCHRVTPFLHVSPLWLRPLPGPDWLAAWALPPSFPRGGGGRGAGGEMRRSWWSLYSWNVWIIAGCVSPFSHITCDRLIVAKLSSHTHDLSVCQDQIDKIKASRNSRYNSTITQLNIVHRLSRFY